MYKVKTKFKDILDPQHFYSVGGEFVSTDADRVKELFKRGFIVEVKTAANITDGAITNGKIEIATKKAKAKVGDKYGDNISTFKD